MHLRNKDVVMSSNKNYQMDYHEAHELVDKYVNSSRWDTLVGRSWNMHDDESRDQFVSFLTHHLVKVVSGEPGRV